MWADFFDWTTWRMSTGIVCSSSSGRTWKGPSDEGTWFRTWRRVEGNTSNCGCNLLAFLTKLQKFARLQNFTWNWGEMEQMLGKMLNRTPVSKLIKHFAFRKSSELSALEVGKTPGERVVLRFSYFHKQTNNFMKFRLGVWLSKYTYNMPLPF